MDKSNCLTENAFETCYASAERKKIVDLDQDIRRIVSNPFVDTLTKMVNGFVVILNEERQVLTANGSFLELIGINDVQKILGLRPGECVGCVNAFIMKGGCGTSPYCMTCGAAISIVTALQTELPQGQTCSLTIKKEQNTAELFFNVKALPFDIEGKCYILLFLQDISVEQMKASLDRSFFHGINNILCTVIGKSELLVIQSEPSKKTMDELKLLINRLAKEVSLHNSLQQMIVPSYKQFYTKVSVKRVLNELTLIFSEHYLTKHRSLSVEFIKDDILFTADFHLVSRVVINMVTNALESTPAGGTVRLTVQKHPEIISFKVWNEGEIPQSIAIRIFQRNFSTKVSMGRGIGTYSMKLLGEQIMGGSVSFESTKELGTTFVLDLPYNNIVDSK